MGLRDRSGHSPSSQLCGVRAGPNGGAKLGCPRGLPGWKERMQNGIRSEGIVSVLKSRLGVGSQALESGAGKVCQRPHPTLRSQEPSPVWGI